MKHSVLNITVSKYSHQSGKSPFECNLMEYLNDYSLEQCLLEMRSKEIKAERDELRDKLPGITPAAICYPSRNEKNVIRRTGLMVFEIIKIAPESFEKFYKIITGIPYVAYCGLSASGQGYWGLVPISNPAKYDHHFEALQLYFKCLGIDKPNFNTALKDMAYFRYYSADRSAYFNHTATVFPFIFQVPVKPKKP